MTIARDTTMGEEPVSYGIATGNRFAMVDIGDDIEDPAEFYNLIEQSNKEKKAEQKKKKDKKPEKKKEEEKPEKKEEESKENTRGRGRGRGGRGNNNNRSRGDGSNYRGNRDGGDSRPRYNRDNDDNRPPRLQDEGGEGREDGEDRKKNYRGNSRGNNRGRGRGGYRGNGRQFDRHSGNDKSGPRGAEKRDGGGSHNWGSPTEEPAPEATEDVGGWGNIEEAGSTLPSGFDNIEQPSGFDNIEQPSGFDNIEGGDGSAAATNAEKDAEREAEEKQMTLEEYQAKMAAEKKALSFNTRKAGENEDNAQWKNFAPLKKDDLSGYMGGMDEYEKIIVRGGRKKNLVDLDVKFTKPSRRGGRGRDDGGRGSGGRGSSRRGEFEERREPSGRATAAAAASNFSESDFPSLS